MMATTSSSSSSSSSSLYDKVQQRIESWVAECHANKTSWEDHKQTLGQSICQLATRTNKPATTWKDRDDQDDKNEDHDNPTKKSRNDTDDSIIQSSTSAVISTPPPPPPKTLLELVQYMLSVFTDEQLQSKELRFSVYQKNDSRLKFQSRDEFLQELDKVSVAELVLQGNLYDENKVQEAYDKIQDILFPTSKIVQNINAVAKPFIPVHDVLPWDETLVDPMRKADLDHVKFAKDSSQGAALVVSGESGSGKTWFAQNFVPNKLGKHNLALIYHSLDSADGFRRIQSDPKVKDYLKACQVCMHQLLESGLGDDEVYECVSKLSMAYSKERDASAYFWLKQVIGESLYHNSHASKWWNMGQKSQSDQVEKLVIVIDEVGKNPDLACSLISIVRRLYHDITVTHKKAQQVLLVLVGSGIDWYIRNDHLPYVGDDETRNTFSTFGTDPQKSNIIVIKGPNLSAREELEGIPTQAILKGTYSNTLATNTRMLTRGILQVLKVPLFSQHAPDMPNGYENLGSTNIVMDYAPRVYISLGALSNLQYNQDLFDKMLLTQFQLLLWESQFSIKDSNPAAVKLLDQLKIQGLDFHQALAMGIVTSDIKSTSPALRYLACDGFSAPLYAKDGLEFDILLEHHLVRLCQAHSVGEKKYWAGHYKLTQTWPPRANKNDAELCDAAVTRKEVEDMYKVRIEYMDRDLNGYDMDIDKIIALVEKQKSFDLVLRQEVHDLQGANFMILRKRKGEYSLDLYYSNKKIKVPGIKSPEFKKAVQLLGVQLDENHNINVSPDYGSAGYTYHGIKMFAEKLGEQFGAPVEIGHRTMILVKGWDGKPADTEFLQKAAEKRLMIWTREMLEPTISTFKSK